MKVNFIWNGFQKMKKYKNKNQTWKNGLALVMVYGVGSHFKKRNNP